LSVGHLEIVGNQFQVSFALPAELLVKVDQAADNLRISRAAFIKQAIRGRLWLKEKEPQHERQGSETSAFRPGSSQTTEES
jgi:metal-responsive CopG/Arc/MetJ family transcriptional regulator